jgi:hypothetical protein
MEMLFEALDLQSLLWGVQALFYVVSGVVIILTFLQAKRTLLNPVNVEYQKRVIENLYNISNSLIDEFDYGSPEHWIKKNEYDEMFSLIRQHAAEALERGLSREDAFDIGTPLLPSILRFRALADRYRSDPFLPSGVRIKLVELLDERWNALTEASIEVGKLYATGLREGKYPMEGGVSVGGLHNRIVDKLYERGVGVSQIEERIHGIRSDISSYFEGFSPLKQPMPTAKDRPAG